MATGTTLIITAFSNPFIFGFLAGFIIVLFGIMFKGPDFFKDKTSAGPFTK